MFYCVRLRFQKWRLLITVHTLAFMAHKPVISLAPSHATCSNTELNKFSDLHSLGHCKAKNGIIIPVSDRGSFTVPHLSVCVLAAVRLWFACQARSDTWLLNGDEATPLHTTITSLQKGSVWRITGIFRLLRSKTELSAALTPFFLTVGKRLTDCV